MSFETKCPFCGSNHLSTAFRTSAWGGTEEELHIICDDCACSAPSYIWMRQSKPSPRKRGDQHDRSTE